MLILLIGLVLFGGSRIPEIGRSLGPAIREFKRGAEPPDPPAGRERGNRPGHGPKST